LGHKNGLRLVIFQEIYNNNRMEHIINSNEAEAFTSPDLGHISENLIGIGFVSIFFVVILCYVLAPVAVLYGLYSLGDMMFGSSPPSGKRARVA